MIVERKNGHHKRDQRLQSCINDLISVLALPAIWSGSKSSHILGLLDVLVTMLRLDFAYARLASSDNISPLEVVRAGDYRHSFTQAQQFVESFNHWLGMTKPTRGVLFQIPR